MLPNVLAQIPINRKRIFQVSMVVGIIVATGTTVFLLQQNQDTRSRASYFVRCGEVSDPSSTANLSAFTIAETLDKSTDTVVQTAERRSSVSPDNFKESLQTRKQALIQSMQSNPKVALANVLDTRERVDIQVVSENCVEEPVEVSGIMDSFVIDYENETSETVYTLETSDNKKLNVHLTEDSDVPSNTQVTLKGFQIDNEVLVDSLDISNFQISEFGENGLISTQAVGHASGDQKVGVILVKFQSATTPPLTQSDLNTVIFTNTNNYYKEVSYDKVSLSGNTFGWFTIPDESGGCSLDTVNRIRNKAFDAATSSMTFRDYERFVIFAYNVTPLGCAFDGLGSVGKGSIETPQGRVNGSWSLVTVKTNTGNMAMQTMIAGHEMGHNFGAGHAKIMNCGTSPLSGGCSVGSEYGDSFSIMGNDIAHMSAPHKEYIGWLPAQNIRTVTSSGSYTIAPIAASSNAVQAIKIPRGNGDFLYIENRERLGFDSNLGRNKPTNVYDGALLHVLQAPHETGLIDFSPPITNPENTPVLPVGSSITDSVSGATVSVTGKTSGTLAVNVTFGGDVVPTFAPTMTTAPTTTQVLTATPTTTVMPTMPTNTQTVTPTTPVSNPNEEKRVNLSLRAKLPGIGSGTGNTTNPKRTTREGMVYIVDGKGDIVEGKSATFTFDQASFEYTTQTSVTILPGVYFVVLRLDNTAVTPNSPFTLQEGDNAIPSMSLFSGDINGDGQLTMEDHSLFVSCFGSKSCRYKTYADVNENGAVDGRDYNIFIRSLLQFRKV